MAFFTFEVSKSMGDCDSPVLQRFPHDSPLSEKNCHILLGNASYHSLVQWSEIIIEGVLKFTLCVHCKYIRPDYDGTLAIHRSSTTIHRRYQLQCKIWKLLI